MISKLRNDNAVFFKLKMRKTLKEYEKCEMFQNFYDASV